MGLMPAVDLILRGKKFSPLSIAGLQLWLKADAGLTLSVAGFTGTGTTVAQAVNTLTGVATKFLSECVIGDNISGANGLNGNVTAIASDTSLTLDSSATIGAETPYTITPVAGQSDRVSTQNDNSGKGYNGTRATQSQRPALKLGVQVGLPMLLYDGQNDSLVTASIAHGIGTGDFHFSIVVKIVDAPSAEKGFAGNGAALPGFQRRVTGAVLGMDWGGLKAFNTTPSVATAYLIEYCRDGGVLKCFVNGVQEANTYALATSMSNAIFTHGNDGAGDFANFYHGESAFYNLMPTAGELVLLRKYFSTRWGLGF